MEPQSIKRVLQNVIDQSGMGEKLEECKALLLWNDVASNLTARTEPVGIAQGKMTVNVTDSVVLYQLTFYKKKYIDKINLMLGKNTVKDIVFRVGKIGEKEMLGANGAREDYITKFSSIQLDQDELAKIGEMVAQIQDEEIQDSLKKLLINQSKLAKMRQKTGD